MDIFRRQPRDPDLPPLVDAPRMVDQPIELDQEEQERVDEKSHE